MSTTMEVVAIRPFDKDSSLKAFISLRIGGVTIHDMKIIQAPGKGGFVAPPSKEVPQPDGGKKYYSFVEFSDGLKEKINSFVMAEWKKFQDEQHMQTAPVVGGDDIPF